MKFVAIIVSALLIDATQAARGGQYDKRGSRACQLFYKTQLKNSASMVCLYELYKNRILILFY